MAVLDDVLLLVFVLLLSDELPLADMPWPIPPGGGPGGGPIMPCGPLLLDAEPSEDCKADRKDAKLSVVSVSLLGEDASVVDVVLELSLDDESNDKAELEPVLDDESVGGGPGGGPPALGIPPWPWRLESELLDPPALSWARKPASAALI